MRNFSISAFFIGLGLGILFSFFFIWIMYEPPLPEDIIKTIPDDIIIKEVQHRKLAQ